MKNNQFMGYEHWLKAAEKGRNLITEASNIATKLENNPHSPELMLDLSILLDLIDNPEPANTFRTHALDIKKTFSSKHRIDLEHDTPKWSLRFFCKKKNDFMSGTIQLLNIMVRGNIIENTHISQLLENTDVHYVFLDSELKAEINIPTLHINAIFLSILPHPKNEELLANLSHLLGNVNIPIYNHPRNLLKLTSRAKKIHMLTLSRSLNTYNTKIDDTGSVQTHHSYTIALINGKAYPYSITEDKIDLHTAHSLSSNILPNEHELLQDFETILKKHQETFDEIHNRFKLDFLVVKFFKSTQDDKLFIWYMGTDEVLLPTSNPVIIYRKPYHDALSLALNQLFLYSD